MLILNDLIGFGAGGGVPTTISFLQLVRDDSDLTTYTYASQNFGGADPRRYLIAALGGRANVARTLNGVTIGGVTATSLANVTVGTTGIVSLWSAYVPTGASGDVVATYSGGMLRTSCALFRLLSDSDATVPTDSQTDNTLSGSDLSVSLAVPVGGVAIAAIHTNTTGTSSATWSGVTESYDQTSTETASQGYSGGFSEYSSSPITITATISGSPTVSVLAAASLR